MFRLLCWSVSSPYSWLYAVSRYCPSGVEWPPGTNCSIQSYTLVSSSCWPAAVYELYVVGKGAAFSCSLSVLWTGLKSLSACAFA